MDNPKSKRDLINHLSHMHGYVMTLRESKTLTMSDLRFIHNIRHEWKSYIPKPHKHEGD